MPNRGRGFPFGGAIGERLVPHGRTPYARYSASNLAKGALQPGALTGAGFLGGLPGFGGVASGGFFPAGGWGWTGWAIAFLVLFFVGIVLWNVWGTVGPVLGGLSLFV